MVRRLAEVAVSSPPAGPQPGAHFGAQLQLLFDMVRPDPNDPSRKYRRKSAYSDQELADFIRSRTGAKVTKNLVGLWKSGRAKPPSIDQVEAICEFFGVTPLHFFADEKSVELKKRLESLVEFKRLVDSGEVTVLLRDGSSTDPRELSALLSVAHVWRYIPGVTAGVEETQQKDSTTRREPEGGAH